MNGYIHRRICYERGIEAEGKEIYEFHGFCTCDVTKELQTAYYSF